MKALTDDKKNYHSYKVNYAQPLNYFRTVNSLLVVVVKPGNPLDGSTGFSGEQGAFDKRVVYDHNSQHLVPSLGLEGAPDGDQAAFSVELLLM